MVAGSLRWLPGWASGGLAAWLWKQLLASGVEGISLGHLSDKFVHNGVDGAFLLELEEGDLITELGWTKLQARKIKSRLFGDASAQSHA